MNDYSFLSDEQKYFVDVALRGCNVWVDAVIGSGKTTAIQALCDMMPVDKHILYLTYNRLLKFDAQAKILNKNVFVQNYHGFAFGELRNRLNRTCSMEECIPVYNQIPVRSTGYDVLILDEYQDIESEMSIMLRLIKESNPGLQIIVVGDMAQKIYDNTSLDVQTFIADFLGSSVHKLEFTRCFRLSAGFAATLGDVWHKCIIGVNPDCEVEVMTPNEIFDYVSGLEPRDLICLGSNYGGRVNLLNRLERNFSHKFNKYTVWSKVGEGAGGVTHPGPESGVFTTYDSAKGLERDVCVLFDWTDNYWHTRLEKAMVKYEIMRNVFCVAASRGKRKIIFCKNKNVEMLDFDVLANDSDADKLFSDTSVSDMFSFKFIEHIEQAYSCLDIKEEQPDGDEIKVKMADGLIDLSICIGFYQEVTYFRNTTIDMYIDLFFQQNKDKRYLLIRGWKDWSIERKVLYYVHLVTGQARYLRQVKNFVISESTDLIHKRLSERLDPNDESQVLCNIDFYKDGMRIFRVNGICDVVKDDVIYELKFVDELSHIDALQLAMYLIAMDKEYGFLWNVRTNRILRVSIPDRKVFMDNVVKAVTKGVVTKYEGGVTV